MLQKKHTYSGKRESIIYGSLNPPSESNSQVNMLSSVSYSQYVPATHDSNDCLHSDLAHTTVTFDNCTIIPKIKKKNSLCLWPQYVLCTITAVSKSCLYNYSINCNVCIEAYFSGQ